RELPDGPRPMRSTRFLRIAARANRQRVLQVVFRKADMGRCTQAIPGTENPIGSQYMQRVGLAFNRRSKIVAAAVPGGPQIATVTIVGYLARVVGGGGLPDAVCTVQLATSKQSDHGDNNKPNPHCVPPLSLRFWSEVPDTGCHFSKGL